jgi:hypothetical protein
MTFNLGQHSEVKVAGDVLMPFALAAGVVGYVTAFGLGVGLVGRGAYRRARNSTSSAVMAVGAGVIGAVIGLLGGWVIADVRVAWRARGRLLWLLAAGAWAIAAGLSEAVASDVRSLPQPNQSVWVEVLNWSPAFPLALALGVLCSLSLRRRRLTLDSARVPMTLLWSSLALACVVVPKPN